MIYVDDYLLMPSNRQGTIVSYTLSYHQRDCQSSIDRSNTQKFFYFLVGNLQSFIYINKRYNNFRNISFGRYLKIQKYTAVRCMTYQIQAFSVYTKSKTVTTRLLVINLCDREDNGTVSQSTREVFIVNRHAGAGVGHSSVQNRPA